MGKTPDIQKMLAKQLEGGRSAAARDCARYDENFFTAYMEERLPADELEQFEKHMTTCQACRQEVTALTALFDRLDEEETKIEESHVAPSALTLKPSMLDRFFGRHSNRWRWAVASLAFALIVGAPLYFVIRPSRQATIEPRKVEQAAAPARSAPVAPAQPEMRAFTGTKPGSIGRLHSSASVVAKAIEWNVGVQVSMPAQASLAADAGGATNLASPPPPKREDEAPAAERSKRAEVRKALVSEDSSQEELAPLFPQYAESVKGAIESSLKKTPASALERVPVIVEITVEKDGRVSAFHSIARPGRDAEIRKEKKAESGPLKVVTETKFPAFPEALAKKVERLTLIVSIVLKS